MNDYAKLSDENVAEIVRSRDKEAYTEIIRRYQDKLMRYASYLLNDEDKAADAVQEGFIKAYINLRGFDSKRKFSSWIYRIVHNQAMNLVSKHKTANITNESLEVESGQNLEDEFIKKELVGRAHGCLEQIPIIYREPLSLFFLEEKKYDEISDILRIPIGTVGTRINRAKVMMKKICQTHRK